MADLAFVNQHNMVTYLEKSDENAEFHQIVDFLPTCSINYALTVSPTIYASYIEQFWNTATSKIGNSVKQIHAIVDGKAVVISESSVRNGLLFDNEDGITCLTNDDIFENLALMGYEQLSTKLTFQKGNGYRWQSQAPRNLGGTPAQTRCERVLKQSNEPPLPKGHTSRSREGRMAHTFKLMDYYINLHPMIPLQEVLDLEKEKDTQAVESSNDDLDVKDASKQGRKSDKTRMFKDGNFDRLDDDMENVKGETVYAATSGVSTTGALVSTARPIVSIAGPSTSVAGTSTGILEDEMVTMADTLIAIRQTRTRPSYLPRPTSVVITDTEQEQRRLTTPPPSQPSDTRDKGKGIMIEPDPSVKIKRSDQGDLQLQADAELAQLLHQDELAQVERIQRERAAQEEASIATLYDRKSYEELQRLYEREQKWINDFVPMDFEKEEKKSVEPESEGKKGKRIELLVMKRFEDNTPEGYNLLLWGDLKSSYIADGSYFDLLQHVSREKVSSYQGNTREDVELEARSRS
ncbi:hypothetical protein Tco_0662468 [Tanacetum coccineum]